MCWGDAGVYVATSDGDYEEIYHDEKQNHVSFPVIVQCSGILRVDICLYLYDAMVHNNYVYDGSIQHSAIILW